MSEILKAVKASREKLEQEIERSKERRQEVRRMIDQLENCPLKEVVKIKHLFFYYI